MKLDEAIKLIRGPKGTDVTLTIYRDDWKENRDIKLTRDVIVLPSVAVRVPPSPPRVSSPWTRAPVQ